MSWFTEANGKTEQEGDEVFDYLDHHLPDPQWSDIISWPSRHPETQAMGMSESTSPRLTADEMVEIAFRYRPIAL